VSFESILVDLCGVAHLDVKPEETQLECTLPSVCVCVCVCVCVRVCVCVLI